MIHTRASRPLSGILLLGLLALAPAVQAEIKVYGYLGVAGEGLPNYVNEIRTTKNIPINAAAVIFGETWTSVDYGAIVTSFQAVGVKAQPWLDNVLFRHYTVASSPCVDGAGPFIWALRADWATPLNNFKVANGAYISPAKTSSIVIFPEINNGCTPLSDIQTAATQVKALFPGIPTVMGYGYDADNGQPPPPYIPAAIDWVGFNDYGYFDPNGYSCSNPVGGLYQAKLNDLLGKLGPNQRILLIPDGWWGTSLHGSQPNCGGTGWPRWYLQYLALNYETLALSQPKVIGMMYWLWHSFSTTGPNFYLGTRDLPAEVQARHREIGCRALGGCP
jgi:hypothetical protein